VGRVCPPRVKPNPGMSWIVKSNDAVKPIGAVRASCVGMRGFTILNSVRPVLQMRERVIVGFCKFAINIVVRAPFTQGIAAVIENLDRVIVSIISQIAHVPFTLQYSQR